MYVINPGSAIKKPIHADVPTARCIFLPKALKIGTVKLPPPIPIKTEKYPIKKLIILFNKKFFGKSLNITILIFSNILIAMKLAIITKKITNILPFIKLAKSAPQIEPAITPLNHFFTIKISRWVFILKKWGLTIFLSYVKRRSIQKIA